MAKKMANKNMRQTRRVRNVEGATVSNERQGRRGNWQQTAPWESDTRDYKEILREFISSPAVRYVAGGIATALLTRLANNMAERYPEISSFIRENMDNLEGKLGEFRQNLQGEDSASRH
jgi:hypothetical protein